MTSVEATKELIDRLHIRRLSPANEVPVRVEIMGREVREWDFIKVCYESKLDECEVFKHLPLRLRLPVIH